MYADDSGGGIPDGGIEHLARVYHTGVERPLRDHHIPHETVLAVEHEDLKLLALLVGESGHVEIGHVLAAAKLSLLKRATLFLQPAQAEFESGFDLARLGGSDTPRLASVRRPWRC